MSLVSNSYFLITLTALAVFYAVPARLQWAVLLVFSLGYYLAASKALTAFLLFSITLTFSAALCMVKYRKRAKRVLIVTLLVNFGILGFLKYAGFLTSIFHQSRFQSMVLPLGISFYTFQAVGYLLDVYWERIEPEEHFLQFALFISFFPQLMQGPIGRYDKLAGQLKAGHSFMLRNILRGGERLLWGLCKKLIIADWAAVYVAAIFDSAELNPALALFGALLYTCQLYMDFSGAIDMVLGTAEMFDIRLDENFRQPFFAKTVAEFWRRWHITLGAWMRDYLLYPVMLSGWMGHLTKHLKKKFGRKAHLTRALPAAIGDMIVFTCVGIWHGAGWNYLLYGMFNGVIVSIGLLLKPQFDSWKKTLHISDTARWFHLFQMIRTWLLTMIWMIMIRAADMGRAIQFIRHLVSRPDVQALFDIPAGRLGVSYTPYALLTIVIGCAAVFLVGLMKERGLAVRNTIASWPLPCAAAVYFALLICIGFFGSAAVSGGFIYAQF